MFGIGTKGAAFGWPIFGGDIAARLFIERVTDLLRVGGVGNNDGIGVGSPIAPRLVIPGRAVPAPKLNVKIPTLDTRNKDTIGIVVPNKLVVLLDV
ncbi:hypothetical protein R1flu_015211 [Riccia fluitans]|uniref:Uncharacterized protein n=1 Tax=Riccia fluitans TaxID=41844 RepID=A0ABD1YIQ2_9MARC